MISAGFGAKKDGQGREGPSAPITVLICQLPALGTLGANVTARGNDRFCHKKPDCLWGGLTLETPRFIINITVG